MFGSLEALHHPSHFFIDVSLRLECARLSIVVVVLLVSSPLVSHLGVSTLLVSSMLLSVMVSTLIVSSLSLVPRLCVQYVVVVGQREIWMVSQSRVVHV